MLDNLNLPTEIADIQAEPITQRPSTQPLKLFFSDYMSSHLLNDKPWKWIIGAIERNLPITSMVDNI